MKLLSCSAYRTPNSMNSEYQFPQFKLLAKWDFFELYLHFWVHFDINLKLLSGKNTQEVNKQNIRDS